MYDAVRRLRDSYHFNPKSVLDIGANQGSWTAAMKKELPQASFTLIEGNRNWLEHLESQQLGDVHIAIVGDRRQRVTYFSKASAHSGNSIYLERTSEFKDNNEVVKETRNMQTVDDLLSKRTYDLVKIDVQGAELDVLKGAKRIVQQAEVLHLELSTTEYNAGAPLAMEVMQAVHQLGFRFYEVVEMHYSSGVLIQIDVLFIHKESPLWAKIEHAANLV